MDPPETSTRFFFASKKITFVIKRVLQLMFPAISIKKIKKENARAGIKFSYKPHMPRKLKSINAARWISLWACNNLIKCLSDAETLYTYREN